MRILIGLVLSLCCIVLGVYYGVWVLQIGSIADFANLVREQAVDQWDVLWAALKWFCGGVLTTVCLYIGGAFIALAVGGSINLRK